MTSRTACATGGSDRRLVPVCPPVVEYSHEIQARAADELMLLPEPSTVTDMISDYAVMREQSRKCASSEAIPASEDELSRATQVRSSARSR